MVPSKPPKQRAAPRPPASLNNADWKTSKAKLLISQDIIDGLIPMEGRLDLETLFNQHYRDHKYFANFPFDQTRYHDRIDQLRKAIGKLNHWAMYDDAALKADRLKYPKQQKDVRGQIKWPGSDAERQLKLDLDAGVHLLPDYTPKKLHAAPHGYYKVFALAKFRKHIQQELTSRKTFDEKTLKKRRSGYKVGQYGDKNMSRNTTAPNNASNNAGV